MPQSLYPAKLIKRYKRFLADAQLENGEQITVHCPNTGAMTGCVEEGATIWLSQSDNPKRKYAYTWELIQLASGDRVCIHSASANRVVERALVDGMIPELSSYSKIQREVKLGEASRVDFVLSEPGCCVVEVKSVTLGLGVGFGAFPDAVSQRASRHLEELITVTEQGDRAVLLLLAMHTGIRCVGPADRIDPKYGDTLRRAIDAGVEVLVYGCEVEVGEVRVSGRLEFLPHLPEALFG